jgi:hypothetical protein
MDYSMMVDRLRNLLMIKFLIIYLIQKGKFTKTSLNTNMMNLQVTQLNLKHNDTETLVYQPLIIFYTLYSTLYQNINLSI